MRRIVDLLVTSTILYNSAAPAPVPTTTPNCTLEGSLSFFYSGERYELVGWGLVGDAGELLPYILVDIDLFTNDNPTGDGVPSPEGGLLLHTGRDQCHILGRG